MPISGIKQPDILPIDESLRLRKFDGIADGVFEWYQDLETVYLVDGVRKAYSHETLNAMYTYLNQQGELYYIEVLENDHYKPIGDVTFWKEDMPIVIGEKAYRGKGIGRKVVKALMGRGKALGYETLYVNEIYDFNEGSRRCFEHAGFQVCGRTEKGVRMYIDLCQKEGRNFY